MLWSPGQHHKQTGGKRGTNHEFTLSDRYGFKNCKKLTNWARAKNIKCETMRLFFKSTHLVHPCTSHHGGTLLENSGTPWGVRYTRLTSTALVWAQARNKIRWRPGQEASLAPPCSNLRSYRSKCSVLKKVLLTLLGLFGANHSDFAPPS